MADGEWHTLLAKFNPKYMEISVDGATETLRPATVGGGGEDGGEGRGQQGNRHVDLSGLLYFGGIEPGAKRSRAFVQGVEAAAAEDAGLEGCLRDLTLDGRQGRMIYHTLKFNAAVFLIRCGIIVRLPHEPAGVMSMCTDMGKTKGAKFRELSLNFP